jgi:signal transduction histidine kinase
VKEIAPRQDDRSLRYRLFGDLPFVACVMVGLFFISRQNYILFHCLVESAIAAATFNAFAFAWNSRRFEHGYLFLLGITSGCVGVLSVLHALAYPGMNVLPENGANFAPQLWLASRYLMASALIVAPFFLKRPLPILPVATVLVTITGLLIAAVFLRYVPLAYVIGEGQTRFKIVSEYVICGMLALGLVLMLRQRHLFSEATFGLLVAHYIFAIGAGLAFSSYLGMYDVSNMVGHFLLLLSSYTFYKAIVETGLRRPFEFLFRELNQAIRARDEFLSIASHELKTPLTPLKMQLQGFQRLLRQGRLDTVPPEQIERVISVSTKQIDRLTYLIDNLLDVSRISAGRLSLSLEPTDVSQLLREVLRRHEAEIAAAECTARVAAPAQPLVVPMDVVRIDQVVTNLLMNALKYAPKSRVELGATVEFDSSLLLWVHDNGPGIPREAHHRVFERFERARAAHQASGLGLGLFISRQIVEAHGGTLHLVSEPGYGCRFELRLPFKKDQ